MKRRGICVWGDNPSNTAQLIAIAREIALPPTEKIYAVVIGSREQADIAATNGADIVFFINEQEDEMPERYISTVSNILETEGIGAFLSKNSVHGRALACLVAARFGVSMIKDVKKFKYDKAEQSIFFVQHILGDNVVRFAKPAADFWAATTDANSHALDAVGYIQGEVIQVEPQTPSGIKVIGCCERKDGVTLLANAERVICAGAGMSRDGDFDAMKELADTLGAEIGCTRGFLERDRSLGYDCQIGISGHSIKPQLYIGLGVSGQIQHTIGIADSQLVIVANKDEDAPFFRNADYGYVGDARDFANALARELAKNQQA